MTTALLIIAYIAAAFFHAPTWVFVGIVALSALEFGFHIGRFTRREVIYIHEGDGVARRHLEASAESIRKAYREAKLPAPIVMSIPSGLTVSRRQN